MRNSFETDTIIKKSYFAIPKVTICSCGAYNLTTKKDMRCWNCQKDLEIKQEGGTKNAK